MPTLDDPYKKGPSVCHYEDKWVCFKHPCTEQIFNCYHDLNNKDAPLHADSINNALHWATQQGWVTSFDDKNQPHTGNLLVICKHSHFTDILHMGEVGSEEESDGMPDDEQDDSTGKHTGYQDISKTGA